MTKKDKLPNSGFSQKERQDIELMLLVQVGDLHAFETLVKKFEKPIYNFFIRLGADLNIAEDLCQNTFLRLWKSAKGYFPQGKFSTYLFQIAKNVFYSFIAKKNKQKEASLEAVQDDSGFDLRLNKKIESPDNLLEQTEISQLIKDAINKLDEKHKLVFILAYFQNFHYNEIAEILKIPLGTVKTRMMHAELKLREKLKPYLKDFFE